MQFKVETAGVAHRLSVGVASPQCCCARVTVGTKGSCPLADNLGYTERVFCFKMMTLLNISPSAYFLYLVSRSATRDGRTSLFFGRMSGLF